MAVENQIIFLKGAYNKIINFTYDDFQKNYKGIDTIGDPNNLTASSKIVNGKFKSQKKELEKK